MYTSVIADVTMCHSLNYHLSTAEQCQLFSRTLLELWSPHLSRHEILGSIAIKAHIHPSW